MPMTQLHTGVEFDFAQPLVWPKTASAPVAAFISNCKASNQRLEYLRELMQYIDVHSYGQCLHNTVRECESRCSRTS